MRNAVEQAFEPMFGLPSWRVCRSIGSHVNWDFGVPTHNFAPVGDRKVGLPGLPDRVPARRSHLKGEWYLRLELCAWTLRWRDVAVATNDSEHGAIEDALHFLKGQALTDVSVKPDSSTRFEFDLGCVIETASDHDAYGKVTDQWVLGLPSGDYLQVRDDGSFSLQPGDETEHVWHPIPGATA